MRELFNSVIVVALGVALTLLLLWTAGHLGSERQGPSTEPSPKQITVCDTTGDC